jgi:hypothetical protein
MLPEAPLMRTSYSTFAPRIDYRPGRPSLHGLGAAGWYGSLCGFLAKLAVLS